MLGDHRLLVLAALTAACLPVCHAEARSKCASDTEVLMHQRDDLAEENDEGPTNGRQDVRSQNCGKQSDLISALKKGAQTVTLKSGKAFSFYPLLLTDKNDWVCNAIKVRIACVDQQVTPSDNGVQVKLRTRPTRPFTEETVTITDEGKAIYPPEGRFFAIVPRERTVKGEKREVGRYALEIASGANCSAALPCETARLVAAERTMLEVLRTDRLPRTVTLERRKEHVRALFDKFADRQGDQLILHRAILLNELGIRDRDGKPLYSPFEILDAVYGRSGPSFGAHQIDMATNESDDRIPFRRVAVKVLAPQSDQRLRSLVPATTAGSVDRAKGALEAPIREYSITLLSDFYRALPLLNSGFGEAEGQNEYFAAYNKFLTTSDDCMAALGGRFASFRLNPFARVYVMDIANHFGGGVASKAARYAAQADTADDAAARLKEYIRESTDYGRSNRSDVDRRIANIERVIASLPSLASSANTSGNASRCQIGSLGRI